MWSFSFLWKRFVGCVHLFTADGTSVIMKCQLFLCSHGKPAKRHYDLGGLPFFTSLLQIAKIECTYNSCYLTHVQKQTSTQHKNILQGVIEFEKLKQTFQEIQVHYHYSFINLTFLQSMTHLHIY